MTAQEFDNTGWRSGASCLTRKDDKVKKVTAVNFEHRTILLADSKNIQNWFFYYEVEILK